MAIITRFHEDVLYSPRDHEEIIDIRRRRGRRSPSLGAVKRSHRRRRGRDEEEYEEEIEIDIERDRRSSRHDLDIHRSRSRPPSRIIESEELVYRREPSPEWKRVERDEIIRRREIDTCSEASFDIQPVAPIRHRPTLVHEDIVEYHRHGKHGRHGHTPIHRTESPCRIGIEEIDIRRRDRHPRDHDESIIEIDVDIHEGGHHRGSHVPALRPREIVPSRVRQEAEHYSRHVTEESSRKGIHQDTTHDWCISDVPSGTTRADDLCGEEISWKRHRGVRRSKHAHDGRTHLPCRGSEIDVHGRVAKRYVGIQEKCDDLWTEITKDLVLKEAIEQAGFEYEETPDFFYIFAYLEYCDVAELVRISEEYRRKRRDRVMEIQNERARAQSLPPPRLLLEKETTSRQLWEECPVREEIIIDEKRRSRRRSPVFREPVC